MANVTMKSWREGFKKVSLTKLQIELLQKPLKESKRNVDLLLEGQEVLIEVEDPNIVVDFYTRAEKMGVNCILKLD